MIEYLLTEPSTIIDFVALCVHSNRMGLVYVKDGKIHDKIYLRNSVGDLDCLESYFKKVEYVLAFSIGTHRKNLKNMFEGIDRSLPDKQYVCVYNWAKKNIGTTTFSSVRNYFGIDPPGLIDDFDLSGWHHRDYILNAEMLAEASIMMQESCGMDLKNAVSGDRESSKRKYWLNQKR